jgi:hypothetical protein
MEGGQRSVLLARGIKAGVSIGIELSMRKRHGQLHGERYESRLVDRFWACSAAETQGVSPGSCDEPLPDSVRSSAVVGGNICGDRQFASGVFPSGFFASRRRPCGGAKSCPSGRFAVSACLLESNGT